MQLHRRDRCPDMTMHVDTPSARMTNPDADIPADTDTDIRMGCLSLVSQNRQGNRDSQEGR